VTESGSDAEIGGDLIEGVEEAEDRSAGGFGSGIMIELAPQETTEGGDAGNRPGGDIEKGTVLYLAVLPEGLAKEDGGKGVPIGDLCHAHDLIRQKNAINKNDNRPYI